MASFSAIKAHAINVGQSCDEAGIKYIIASSKKINSMKPSDRQHAHALGTAPLLLMELGFLKH